MGWVVPWGERLGVSRQGDPLLVHHPDGGTPTGRSDRSRPRNGRSAPGGGPDARPGDGLRDSAQDKRVFLGNGAPSRASVTRLFLSGVKNFTSLYSVSPQNRTLIVVLPVLSPRPLRTKDGDLRGSKSTL